MSRYGDSDNAPAVVDGDPITSAIDTMAGGAESVLDGLERIFGVKKTKDAPALAPTATPAPTRIEAAPVGRQLSSGDRAFVRELALSPPEMKMLGFIAERGGSIPWDWGKCRPDVKAMIATMINKQIIVEQERVTHAAQANGALYLALTDIGRQCLTQLAKMQPRRLTSGS
jgi:hypothetical protein